MWLDQMGLDACDLDDRTPLNRALSLVPNDALHERPSCVAIQAELSARSDNAQETLELFRRALRSRPVGDLAIQIHERVVAHLFSLRSFSEMQTALDAAMKLAGDDVRINSLAVAMEAQTGSIGVEAIARLADEAQTLPAVRRSRVFLRLGSAAYAIGKLELAERYAHSAAEAAGSVQASRLAAIAFHNLALLHASDLGDPSKAARFVRLCADAAQRCRDESVKLASLSFAYGFAAETADRDLLVSVRDALNAVRRLETDATFFSPVIAESIFLAIGSNWQAMHRYLAGVHVDGLGPSQRALCFGLRALAALGSDDDPAALQHAYRALHLGRPLRNESLEDVRFKLLARLFASAVLLRSKRRNEASRGIRAYRNQMNAPMKCLAEAILSGNYDSELLKSGTLAGYALLLKSSMQGGAAGSNQPALTSRELDVLRGFSSGGTSRSIAAALRISTYTVEWHAERIREKFGGIRMNAVIAQLRDLDTLS